jgi:MtrB/PioB family decaheme-associated outer membrane protein
MNKKNAIILLLLLSPTVAADNDFSHWKCKLCPTIDGWYGNLSFGLGYSDQSHLAFANYRGVDENGLYLSLDTELHFRNDKGNYFNLYAENLGLENRQIKLNTGKQGKYKLRFGWNEIPKYRGFGSQTPFLGVGSDTLTLPSNWQPDNSTNGFTQLENSLSRTDLKTHRKVLDAGIEINFESNWEYQLDYQNQKKQGTRPFGSGLFFQNTSVFPAPVDFNTDQIDMRLSYSGARGHIQFGAFGSWFKNQNNSITWQNPFSTQDSTQTLRSSLEPDNNFYQINLTGAFLISPKLRASGQVAIGRIKQDDAFLPYSINPDFSDVLLPRLSLDGQLDTSTFNLGGKISARVNNKLTFTTRVKINERENKTSVDLYSPITTDLAPLGDRTNRPYSYKKKNYSLDMRYRAHRNVRINTGIKYKDTDRTLQQIENSKEDIYWGEIKIFPTDFVQIRLKVENSDRNVSDYLQAEDGGPIDHPLLRKFNQADRDREHAQIQVDINPTEKLGINFSYYYAKDNYRESPIGLQDSDDKSYTLDVNYTIADKINITAFYEKNNIDALLTNAANESEPIWTGLTSDEITTKGLGLSTQLNLKSQMGLNFIRSNSTGQISVQTDLNEDPFTPLLTDLKNTTLYFEYQVNKHWGYRFNAEYEVYNSTDWAIDGIATDGLADVLLLGTQSPNYDAWIVRVQAQYQF